MFKCRFIHYIGRNTKDLLEIILLCVIYIIGMIMIFMPTAKNKETRK